MRRVSLDPARRAIRGGRYRFAHKRGHARGTRHPIAHKRATWSSCASFTSSPSCPVQCRLFAQREGLPRHRRRRRVQNPRAGCRAARPHRRRARRRAPSRGRGLRQRRRRQEHLDAASRGRSARAGASDCDPRRGLQRPLTGAHGRCPGRAVRSRQPQGRAPADQRTGSGSSRWAR